MDPLYDPLDSFIFRFPFEDRESALSVLSMSVLSDVLVFRIRSLVATLWYSESGACLFSQNSLVNWVSLCVDKFSRS